MNTTDPRPDRSIWQRREALKFAAAAPLGLVLGLRAADAAASEPGLPPGAPAGPPTPFSFDRLVERARVLAAAPYQPPKTSAGAVLQTIDYD
ncbi:MAG: glucan biosynthesis protein D, partial [Gammaproteobacteria bacterium]